ncbi:MAG: alanine--tRNA ligase, partial [Opitutales bacterium]|nr:alanine--tRNA ligase [Opitutales bacterium]
HTFFEMLGNWSFGDYFKKEAIQWAWELLVDVWHFPKERLYATVYEPLDGEPAERDNEAYELWKEIFTHAGLDPNVHIVAGHKKDNFWMMGDMGPCGPCSEIHIDLTPNGHTDGRLVNKGDARCIEIWNLVFMQYNALADGSLEPLKNHYVDTGMGLERIAGILATTRNFTDFSKTPSNYESDLFQPLFEVLEQWSGHRYGGRVPTKGENPSPEEKKRREADIAFRVIADHVRAATFAVADGIYPGNEGRNYVLRKIIRRAVYFGQKLGLHQKPEFASVGFFARLASVVVRTMGDIFPELKNKAVCEPLEIEERLFRQTLDKGMRLLQQRLGTDKLSGKDAFLLYDTYGYPLALTQLIAKEHGITVDEEEFQNEMAQQKERSRAASKKTSVQVTHSDAPECRTRFVGYDLIREDGSLKTVESVVSDVVRGNSIDDRDTVYVIVEQSPFYGEKGGQIGDSGFMCLTTEPKVLCVKNTIWQGNTLLHEVQNDDGNPIDLEALRAEWLNKKVRLEVNIERRKEISRHHTATHLLQWALRRLLNPNLHQCGSSVTDERLRFDFNHYEKVSSEQLAEVEKLCNEVILENAPVTVEEKNKDDLPNDCVALFGEKYGDIVRMVSIGKEKEGGCWLQYGNGSRELCGGTHVHHTGELGAFCILKESSVSAGIRRIEACVGTAAYRRYSELKQRCETLETELEKSKKEKKNEASNLSTSAVKTNVLRALEAIPVSKTDGDALKVASACLTEAVDVKTLRGICGGIFKEQSLDVLAVACEKLLLIFCSDKAVEKQLPADRLLKHLLAQCGGRGGGKETFATGSVEDASRLATLLKQPSTFAIG